MHNHIIRSTIVLGAAGACGVLMSFDHPWWGVAAALLSWLQLGCLIEDVEDGVKFGDG